MRRAVSPSGRRGIRAGAEAVRCKAFWFTEQGGTDKKEEGNKIMVSIITGGTGFLGSNLCARLLREGRRVMTELEV